jgi:hypothetical protein
LWQTSEVSFVCRGLYKKKNMLPYNTCENRWLSSTKKKVKLHWMEYEPVYAVLAGIVGIAVLVLALVTSISSFLP